MAQRGRVSAEAKTTPVVVRGDFNRKAEPPDDLTDAQKKIWRETVASEASDTFGTAATKAILKDYCRHRAEAERLSEAIDTFKTEWLKNSEGIKRYSQLTRTRAEETRAATNMARSLRLTNQSRYNPSTAGTASRNALKQKMPWDFDGTEEEETD